MILWSFLIEIIGSSITSNRWLLDTAMLTHFGPVPATGLHWTALASLTGFGVIAALAGLAAFSRRDLAAALLAAAYQGAPGPPDRLTTWLTGLSCRLTPHRGTSASGEPGHTQGSVIVDGLV